MYIIKYKDTLSRKFLKNNDNYLIFFFYKINIKVCVENKLGLTFKESEKNTD